MTPAEACVAFGMPTLIDEVKQWEAEGLSQEEAIHRTARDYELRSEAIEVLRIALRREGKHG